MSRPLTSGEIDLYDSETGRPIISVRVSAAGEWSLMSFCKPEEHMELSIDSARRLEEFIAFHRRR